MQRSHEAESGEDKMRAFDRAPQGDQPMLNRRERTDARDSVQDRNEDRAHGRPPVRC